MKSVIQRQEHEIEELEDDVASQQRTIENLATQLQNWENDTIDVVDQQYIPYYYFDQNHTLTISTELAEHFPAFVKPKGTTSYFVYVPDWTQSVWPSTQYDIGILNLPLQCGVYVKQIISYYTKYITSEVSPTYEPTLPTITPNYVRQTNLLTDGNTWCYSKIRIRFPSGWMVVASEKDHNWWWFEGRTTIIDIE